MSSTTNAVGGSGGSAYTIDAKTGEGLAMLAREAIPGWVSVGYDEVYSRACFRTWDALCVPCITHPMNVNLLIDSIVRQTTVLIAQLATSGGGRPSLAHTANQVFVSLVRELKEQGVGNKVIADMFGMALRTYHDRVRRLEESSTYGGRSLWEAVLEYVQERGTVVQTDVLSRFRNDDQLTVRGVLQDLVDSGVVFRTGRGSRTTLRAASAEEVRLPEVDDSGEGLSNLVWVAVNRLGPSTAEQIAELVPAELSELEGALQRLVADGKVTRTENAGRKEYTCDGCLIPRGATNGWEAAVFDHFQAIVTAIGSKLRQGKESSTAAEHVGGSTYNYWIWTDHPMREEVLGSLQRMRDLAVELRERLDTYNATQTVPRERMTRVIFYLGQTYLEPEESGERFDT